VRLTIFRHVKRRAWEALRTLTTWFRMSLIIICNKARVKVFLYRVEKRVSQREGGSVGMLRKGVPFLVTFNEIWKWGFAKRN